MERIFYRLAFFLACLVITITNAYAQSGTDVNKIFRQQYNLVPGHSKDTQYYEMESRLQKQALDGSITGVDIYHFYLRCVPSPKSTGDEYTCLKFTVQVNNTPAITIPTLTNWKYTYLFDGGNENQSNSPLFGIDPGKFEHLTDSNNKELPVENTYHIYNAFVDFHTMDVFAERAKKDSGIQDLKYVGDKIVHSASYSQPHVSMGDKVSEKSYFKNGKIILEFKGLTAIKDHTCAIIGYDSGESSFYMLTKPIANMEVGTKGSSHYWGDIYKDLVSGWIQKAELHELVISETVVPGMNNKITSIIERAITIKKVARSQATF